MRRLLLALCLLVCCSQIFIRAHDLEQARVRLYRPPDIFYLPPAPVLQLLSLDYEGLLADLIWIKTILYFADQFIGGQDYRHLYSLLDIVTDLDPRFEKVYMWGGAAFIYNGRYITRAAISQSTQLLKKGWDFYRESLVKWRISDEFWRLPFMIGFNYAIELHEKENGAPYFMAAARFPNIPPFMRTLAATMYRKVGAYEQSMGALEELFTIESLRSRLQLVQDEEERQNILNRIRHLYNVAQERQLSTLTAEDMRARRQRLEELYRAYLQDFSYLNLEFYQLLYSQQSVPLPYPSALMMSGLLN